MHFGKPHLTVDQQLAQLAERGLRIRDHASAKRLLATIGYYRFSAYAYPFRVKLGADAVPETTVQYRANAFQPGARFEWAENLWLFDRALRLLVLDAVEMVEIALRAKVGYHLGSRDPFGHLARTSLDAFRCDIAAADDPTRTGFDVWLERYRARQARTAEDFVRHYVEKYDARLPIWVATEILEFGQLVRLYGYLRDDDRSRIGAELAGVSGAVFERWLKLINYVRNVSAHHARLWNRALTYTLGRLPDTLPDLVHLNGVPAGRKRVYAVCAILAAVTESIRPESNWRSWLIRLMDQFPVDPPVSPEAHMGFPSGWRELDLWSRPGSA